jgi:hypothetical protein
MGDLNSRKASVSIGPARYCIEEIRHNRDQISSAPAAICKFQLVPGKSVPVSGRGQLREREFKRSQGTPVQRSSQ